MQGAVLAGSAVYCDLLRGAGKGFHFDVLQKPVPPPELLTRISQGLLQPANQSAVLKKPVRCFDASNGGTALDRKTRHRGLKCSGSSLRCSAVLTTTARSDHYQEAGHGSMRREAACNHLYRLSGLRQGVPIRLAANEADSADEARGLTLSRQKGSRLLPISDTSTARRSAHCPFDSVASPPCTSSLESVATDSRHLFPTSVNWM